MRKIPLAALLVILLPACGGAVETSTTTEVTTTTEPTTTTTLAPVVEATEQAVRSITVGGIGAEYAEPVRCIVQLGIESRRPSVEASTRAATAAAAAMTAALTAAGIEANNIQTTNFSIQPYYDRYPNLAGYTTGIDFRVTMQNVDDVGSLLAIAVQAGGDSVRASGVRFETDHEGLIGPARAEAWADVEQRARELADLAGEPLGSVLDVHEKVLITSPQGMMQGGEGDSASFSVPVSPGVSGVIVLLTVTYAIGQPV